MLVNKIKKENNINPIHSLDIEISNINKDDEDNLYIINYSNFQDNEYYQSRRMSKNSQKKKK